MTLADSYVDTSEAETYFDGDPRADAFLSADMEWYLKRATAIIDSLYLKGTTYLLIGTGEGFQERQFPRVINGRAVNWDATTSTELVPDEVKNAVFEEALALYDLYASSGSTKRRKLQEQGVISFSIGKMSESYAPGSARKWKGLHSQEAYDFMKQYVAGAVRPIP